MSIPPLVCNTPPPPDQCEEEKEDFDLHYSLSQDDDESEFDFQGFPSYNNQFQSNHNQNVDHKESFLPMPLEEIIQDCNNDIVTTNDILNKVIIKSVPLEPGSRDCKENLNITENTAGGNTEITDDKKTEETNIEDLNLTVLEEEPKIAKQVNTDNVSLADQQYDKSNEDAVSNNLDNLDTHLFESEINQKVNIEVDVKEITPPSSPNIDTAIDITETNLDTKNNVTDVNVEFTLSQSSNVGLANLQNTEVALETNQNIDDEFGDFEDFKVSDAGVTPTTVIDDFHNPWGNQAEDSTDFNEFKANFDSVQDGINVISQDSSFNLETKVSNANLVEDDEFGDFDEFQSSSIPKTENDHRNGGEFSCESVGMLNLQGAESNLLENVNKVFNKIFENEIPRTEVVIEDNLDTFLGETWRHLLDTDERLPYVVAWNNSSGQKTLLKSLCIDSRNILFAPKWNSNMPKFAANLSNAPLQPQKQASSANSAFNEAGNDRQPSKPSSTWTDPFSADGQESCKTDKEGTSLQPRPAEPEIFPPVLPTNPDKIYSSTLSVQPIRQINLPDTHIFTPTDSETPRSKTIHYGSGPSISLPQSSSSQSSSLSVEQEYKKEADNDNEYWEFQDFKGASETYNTKPIETIEYSTSVTATSQPTLSTVETQILQPVKVDLLMPTLNWPDPGEVKETFDDFSDFISQTTNIDSEETKPATKTDLETNTPEITNKASAKSLETNEIKSTFSLPHKLNSTAHPDSFDDEFDTFQSALPSKGALVNTDPQVPVNHNFDYSFFNNTHNNTISTENMSPNTVLNHNQTLFNVKENSLGPRTDFPTNFVPLQTTEIPMKPLSILQPIVANSNTTTQKTGQILQPLSLESYSQINWPNPGIDLQDLSRFNPVDTLQSLKSDLSTGSNSKGASPVHINNHKVVQNQSQEDDIWGEFVSSKPKQPTLANPAQTADEDEWSDFISSPTVKPQNGLNTISFNVHTNTNLQKTNNGNKFTKSNENSLDIPTLNYITPKSGSSKSFSNDRHLQRL